MRHGRADAGGDQFLDDFDGLAVGGVEELGGLVGVLGGAVGDHRLAGQEVLHDGAEDGGLRCDSTRLMSLVTEMKSEPRNTPVTPGMREQRRGQRRRGGRIGGAEVARFTHQHFAAGQEFQRRRVGRGFRLDEHGQSDRIGMVLK